MLTFPLTPVPARTSKGYHFEFALIPGTNYTNAEIEAFSPAGKLVNTGGVVTHDFMSYTKSTVVPGSYGNAGSHFND